MAFIYNAGEGSIMSMPVVQRVLDCYNQLKAQRIAKGENAKLDPCRIDIYTDKLGSNIG